MTRMDPEMTKVHMVDLEVIGKNNLCLLTFNQPDVKIRCMNFKTINMKQELSTTEMTCRDNFHAGYFSYLLQFQG